MYGQDRWRGDLDEQDRFRGDVYDRNFGGGPMGMESHGSRGDQSRGDMDWQRRQGGGSYGSSDDRGMGQRGAFGMDGDFGDGRRNQQSGYRGYQGGQGYLGQSFQSQGAQGGYAAQSHRGKGPKGYARSDERVKEMVSEHLTDHHDIDASEITVEAKDGEITLTGTVKDRETKRLVEREVERLSCVSEVINQLRVKREEQETGNRSGNGSKLKNAGTERRNENQTSYEASKL